MATAQTNPTTLDDFIFAHKNKLYGAYDLRQNYERTMSKAFIIGTGLFVSSLFGFGLYAKINAKPLATKVTLTGVSEIENTIRKKQEVLPEIPKPEPEQTKVKEVPTIKYLKYEVAAEADSYDSVPDQSDLAGKALGQENILGDPTASLDILTDYTDEPKEDIVTIKADENTFLSVEIEAEFPGGKGALSKFLADNLRYPTSASAAGVEGAVYIQFTVSSTGKIKDAVVTKRVGYGCDEEALRVINAMPKWIPGKQQGNAVQSKFTLPITFKITE
jgi:periplasmic protein TonB